MMKMESRYYTPDISDLYVGYECERRIVDFSEFFDIFLPEGATQEEYDKAWSEIACGDKWKWEPYIIRANQTRGQGPDISEDHKPLLRFRTPYLTKEKIEAEGWIENKSRWLNDKQRVAWTPDYEVETSYGSLRVYVRKLDAVYEEITLEKYVRGGDGPFQLSSKSVAYSGPCPSINEFRKICKLIGI
jgi:hypothetical protein